MTEENLTFINQQDTTYKAKINVGQQINKISVNQLDSLLIKNRQREIAIQKMQAKNDSINRVNSYRRKPKKIVFDTNEIPYLKSHSNKELSIYQLEPEQFQLLKYDQETNHEKKDFYIEEVACNLSSESNLIKEHAYRYNTDWFFGVFILIFLLFALIRLRFKKQLYRYFSAIFSLQSASNTFRNNNILMQRTGVQLNILFIVSFGLYGVQLMEYINFKPFSQNIFNLILGFSFPLTFIVYKYILSKLVGFFSYRTQLFNEFFYNTNLYIKAIGILSIPFVIFIPYLNSVDIEILFKASFIANGIIIFLWILRTFQIFIRKGVSIFFLILYLCALEILPILILGKFLSV